MGMSRWERQRRHALHATVARSIKALPATRKELLARLRRAPCGDRVMDVWVHFTFRMPSTHQFDAFMKHPDENQVPHYTSSLDAALTLFVSDYGANKAAFLHAVMWQRFMGQIPDERLALVCVTRMLEEALRAVALKEETS